LSILDVPFPVLLSTLIRSRFQAKPATLLIPINFSFPFRGGGALWSSIPKRFLSLINVGGVVFTACVIFSFSSSPNGCCVSLHPLGGAKPSDKRPQLKFAVEAVGMRLKCGWNDLWQNNILSYSKPVMLTLSAFLLTVLHVTANKSSQMVQILLIAHWFINTKATNIDSSLHTLNTVQLWAHYWHYYIIWCTTQLLIICLHN